MNQLEAMLQNVKRVVSLSHVHPDEDCIGSYLAAFNCVRACYGDKQVDACLEPMSKELAFLSDCDNVRREIPEEKEYDLYICLDGSDEKRLGEFGVLPDDAEQSICVDHHAVNARYAMKGVVKPFASPTCGVFSGRMDEGWVDKPIIRRVYISIIHDAGVFKFSNTPTKTMVITRRMMKRRVDFSRVVGKSFFQKNYLQTQVPGRALFENIAFLDKRCILSVINREDMGSSGVGDRDLDRIMNQLRVAEGMECTIFLYETGNHIYRTSLHSSTQVDISKIASYFGDGGHIRAAGCTMSGSIHDVISSLSEHIEKQLV